MEKNLIRFEFIIKIFKNLTTKISITFIYLFLLKFYSFYLNRILLNICKIEYSIKTKREVKQNLIVCFNTHLY